MKIYNIFLYSVILLSVFNVIALRGNFQLYRRVSGTMKLTGLFVLLAFNLFAQTQADIRLNPQEESSQPSCYDIQLKQNGSSDMLLSGQIYRLYYASAAMEFDEQSLQLALDKEYYTMNLVQHQNHVDGSHIGKLSFDKDLGFINFSIILNGTNTRGDYLKATGEWLSTASLCFNPIDKNEKKHIILARSELTADYGRAYVELSYVDKNGIIQNLPLATSTDYTSEQ